MIINFKIFENRNNSIDIRMKIEQALKHNNLEYLKNILDNDIFNINDKILNNNTFTILMTASMFSSSKIVEFLLNYGADPNIKNNYDITALYLCGKDIALYKNAEILLKYGADPNIKAYSNFKHEYFTLLNYIVSCELFNYTLTQKRKLLKLYLDNGADMLFNNCFYDNMCKTNQKWFKKTYPEKYNDYQKYKNMNNFNI